MSKRAITAFALPAMLLVLLLPLTAGAQTASDPSATSSLLVKLVSGLSVDEQAAVIARNGGVETSSIPALRLHVVAVSTADQATILAAYRADPLVQSAEVNTTRQSETVPADPLYAYQWALPRIGWEQVFDTITPAGSATVALLDTGVDASHPELAGTVVPGISMLDGSDGRTDPSGHGTSLAGIIAAATDNIPMEGIAGVAYAGVQIMPVTVLDANGEGQDSDVIRGVLWAADHGADVILMAFSAPQFSQNLQDAIDYAWSKGVVVVAAAGNNASSAPTFPAGDRGVMGVAATDQSDTQAYFSNEGQAVFIAAPGVEIQTIDLDGNYVVLSGTSTAAAHVAGLAAFMKAVDPTLTNGVIVGRIARNADPAGTAAQTGNGRINMPRALADTSLEPVQPAGADPVGDGGPFVGPYQAAKAITVTITGTVTDSVTSAPLPGVTVVCSNSCSGPAASRTATTNASGHYTILNVQANTTGSAASTTVTVQASRSGYQTQSDSAVSVTDNQSTTKNFALVPACTPPSITTHPSGAATTVGDSVTFSVVASGTALHYQWAKNGTNVGGDDSSHTIPAVVSADAGLYTVVVTNTCGSATSNDATLTVSKRATQLTLSSSTNPSTFGESVTFTATVTGTGAGAGNPDADGHVTFRQGAATLCSNVPLNAGGIATCATAALTAGSHAITTEYRAGTNFMDSDGTLVGGQTVNKRATSTGVTASKNPSTYGESVTFTATVTGTGAGAGNPDADGHVTFRQGAATLCSNVPLTAGGIATCATAALTAGSHTITAEYRQGSNFADSDGPLAGGQTVSKAPLAVTATDASTTYGEAHPTFDVSYDGFVNAEGAGALGGTLIFSFAGKPPTSYGPSATVPVNAGAYAIRPGGLTSDNYEITFRGGTYIINRATPTVSLTGGPFTYDGSQHGATVAATGVGGAPVGGSATTSYAGLPPLAYGPSPTEPVNAGTYTVLVAFTSSDPNYTDAQGTGQIVINRRPASVTPDNAGKIFGNPEPSPLTTGTLSGFVPADAVAATYSRTPGETVGPYTISATLSPASALDNYDVTYNTAVFTIGAWNAQGHGFYQPVGVSSSIFLAATGPVARVPSPSGQTVWSVARGGSAIPLKFNVYAGDVEKTSTSVVTFSAVKLASCGADGDGEMPIDFVTTGNTSLRYDTTDRQFVQTWKTPSVSSEACYRATATFADGSTLSAFFKLRK